jgi:hypothetical protein
MTFGRVCVCVCVDLTALIKSLRAANLFMFSMIVNSMEKLRDGESKQIMRKSHRT